MRPAARVLLAIVILASLGGCAASQRASYDPDKPAKICPSTSEGGEAKTFCY